MKPFASFVLYVLSIAVAVGIGMSQAGKIIEGDMFASNAECKIERKVKLCISGPSNCDTYEYSSTKEAGNAPFRNAMEMSVSKHTRQCYSLENPECNIDSILKRPISWDPQDCAD